MNDITALMATMKAAAEKATPGEWRAFTHPASGTYAVHTPKDKRCEDVIKWPGFDGRKNAGANANFVATANPANVLALVEALEAKDAEAEWMRKRIEELASDREVIEERRAKWFQMAAELGEKLDAADKRIAELEKASSEPVAFIEHSNLEALSRGVGAVYVKNKPELARPVALYAASPALESRTVTVKLPLAVSVGGQGYREQVVDILAAAGIQVIEGEGQCGGNCE